MKETMSKRTRGEQKQKKNIGKKILKVLGVILCVIVIFAAITTAVTVIGDKATMKKARSFETVSYENQLVPEKEKDGYWTFTTDRELKILHLTEEVAGLFEVTGFCDIFTIE